MVDPASRAVLTARYAPSLPLPDAIKTRRIGCERIRQNNICAVAGREREDRKSVNGPTCPIRVFQRIFVIQSKNLPALTWNRKAENIGCENRIPGQRGPGGGAGFHPPRGGGEPRTRGA